VGFRNQFDNLRFFKRSRRLKGAPLWQDQVPEEQAAKDTYKIAAQYQSLFSRAFLAAVRELLPDRMPLGFKAAYRQRSAVNVESVVFGVEFGQEAFVSKLESAYAAVLDAAGGVATEELNKDFDINVQWSLGIQKAEAAEDFQVPIVPVNAYSVKWMRQRSLELVKDLNVQQRKVIQGILTDGFEKGLRAEEAYAAIKDNIGLTGRESQAVLNRRALLESEDFPPAQVDKQVEKYRNQLLRKRAERIARTETIAANSAGRSQAWQLAKDSGALPEVQRVWISAPPSPNPNRPCEICLELDGTTAPVGGYYESSIVGPVQYPGPEAHPS
jgi:hypothetical protein